MLYRSKGFSLLEIIISISILSVLASVAIPQYNTYMKKVRVAEAIELTYAIRMSMEMAYIDQRAFPDNGLSISARNQSIGLNDPSSYQTDTIEAMWVGTGGVPGTTTTSGHIAVTLDPDLEVGNGGTGIYSNMLLSTLEWTGTGFKFTCGDTNTPWPSSIRSDFIPDSCKN